MMRSGAQAVLTATTAVPRPRWRRMRLGTLAGAALTIAWMAGVYLYMLMPLVVVAGASFSGAAKKEGFYVAHSYVQFPPEHLTLAWYGAIPAAQLEALLLSFGIALGASFLACVMGVPAALGLVRASFPGKAIVSSLFRAPLQIPAVVSGIAFLQLYYAVGDLTDLYINGTFIGLMIGHVFLATPFVIGTVSSILQRFNLRLEEAALTLGASRWGTFRQVTLPVIMPGVYAGALYAFMVSFGDVPVSMFLGGSGFNTYPVELFYSMEGDFSPSSLASATVVMVFSLVMLLAVQRIIGLDNLLRSKGGR